MVGEEFLGGEGFVEAPVGGRGRNGGASVGPGSPDRGSLKSATASESQATPAGQAPPYRGSSPYRDPPVGPGLPGRRRRPLLPCPPGSWRAACCASVEVLYSPTICAPGSSRPWIVRRGRPRPRSGVPSDGIRCQGQGVLIGGNAVPQIFNQTNAFIQRQVSQIGVHVY